MERRTLLGRLSWQIGEVIATRPETVRVRSITLDLSGWMGHRAGQHVDVRLTAEDGYQAKRSYSIASPPVEAPRVTLTVERLDDGRSHYTSTLPRSERRSDHCAKRREVGIPAQRVPVFPGHTRHHRCESDWRDK
jgi:ferredoxin-NADP reductase